VADFFDTGIKILSPETSALIPAVTMMRSRLIMNVFFFVHNTFLFVACFVNSSLKFTLRITLVQRKLGYASLTAKQIHTCDPMKGKQCNISHSR
jgi:hypothetical protein